MYAIFLGIAWCILCFSAFNATLLLTLNIAQSINTTEVMNSMECPMTVDNWVSAISTLNVVSMISECMLLAGWLCNKHHRHCCIWCVWDTLICFIGGHLLFFGSGVSLFIYAVLGHTMTSVCNLSMVITDKMNLIAICLIITIPLWVVTYIFLAIRAHQSSRNSSIYREEIHDEN